jgi:hypothetical protein
MGRFDDRMGYSLCRGDHGGLHPIRSGRVNSSARAEKGAAHPPFNSPCCGGGYDPMDRPYRIRGLRDGGIFYSAVISAFSRTNELEALAGRRRIVVVGL